MSTATIMTTTIASAIQRAVRAFSDGSGSGVNGSSSLGGKTWSLSSPSTTIESCRSSTSCCSSVIGVSFLVLASRQTREDRLGHATVGRVDHLAVETRDAVDAEDAPRTVDLRVGRRVDLVADRDLRGVDAPLPLVAETARAQSRRAQSARVVEHGERPVDGRDAERAGGRLPRFVLALRRDRVFEVEDHLVHREPRGLGELPLVVARHGQTAAAEASAHVAKLTISVRARHGTAKRRSEARFMRYLAAIIGLLGTLVLLAPVH